MQGPLLQAEKTRNFLTSSLPTKLRAREARRQSPGLVSGNLKFDSKHYKKQKKIPSLRKTFHSVDLIAICTSVYSLYDCVPRAHVEVR